MKRTMNMQELIQLVNKLAFNSGGALKVSGIQDGIEYALIIDQTEFNDTPVCLIGGLGNHVEAISPYDTEKNLPAVLGRYFDPDTTFDVNDFQSLCFPKSPIGPVDGSMEQEAARALAEALNHYSFDTGKFTKGIDEMHPTIQQSFCRLIKACILFMGEKSNRRLDERNRASYECCHQITDIVRKWHLPLV